MRVLLGVLLILVACAALVVIIVVPVLPPLEDNATVDTYLAAILCKPNEKMVREQYTTRDVEGTGYSMTPYCVNSERQQEDVTGKWVLVGGGGFVIPFLLGLFLVIAGASAAARRQSEKIIQSIPKSYGGSGFSVINASGVQPQDVEFRDGVLKVGSFELNLEGLTAEKIKAMQAQVISNAGGDLTTKLRQLQEARDNGLISSSEFETMRRKILDEIS